MIKAEELMLGDWLKYGTFDKIVKVTALYGSMVNTNVVTPLFPDDLEPIPITPEILEKNGFDTMGKCYSLLELDEQTWLEYYWHEHRLRRKWHGVDERNNHAEVNEVSFECQCHYVHELQHALKLCGINKNINL